MAAGTADRKAGRGRPRGGTGIPLPHLRRERVRRGWTIERLHGESTVAASQISGLENGRQGAQAATIRKLADALGVSPEELMG